MNRLKKYLEKIAKQKLDPYVYITGEYGFPEMPEGYAAIQQYGVMQGHWNFADVGVYPTTFINLRTGARTTWCITDDTKIKLIDNELCMVEESIFVENKITVSKVFRDVEADYYEGGEF